MILKEYSWEFDMKCIVAMLLMNELPILLKIVWEMYKGWLVAQSVYWVQILANY